MPAAGCYNGPSMYLLNELLIATPLALYAFFRIRSLIGPRSLKTLWIPLFVLIAGGFPLAELLARWYGRGFGGRILLSGYYGLPLLIYLILTVIAVDLLIGLARLTGLVSRDAVRSPRFKAWRLAVSAGLPVLVVVLGAINHRVIRVHEYRIELPRRGSAAREMTIVFMADTHFRDVISDRFLEELSAKVNAQKPDLILLGGDLLEGDRRNEDTGRYERTFRRMSSTYGIYGAPGNHEHLSRLGTGFMDRAGIRLLQDEVVRIDDTLALAGRKDAHGGGRKPVAELLAAAPPDLPLILIAHRPEEFDKARAAGAAIQLSGHTHHGQLFPINLITSRQYELSWGHLERDGAHLIVTSGVQAWGPMVRTVGYSEIVVIRLVLR
jgi:predicted MPP superfamily phosphohydrolase